VLQADGEKKKMRVNISLEQLIIPGAYPAPLLPSMHFLGSISDISSPSEPPSPLLLPEASTSRNRSGIHSYVGDNRLIF